MDSDLLRAKGGVFAAGIRQEGSKDADLLPICDSTESGCRLQTPPTCIRDGEEVCIEYFTILIFPFLALFIGALSVPASRAIKVPYTLFLLTVGIFIGVVSCAADLGLLSVSINQWVHLHPPSAFFFVFLAPLIFEASFNTRWHVFKRLLAPILTAAFIIVILQAGLIASFQKIIVRYSEWSWWAAFMFGAMLSATDPISVTATLKALGASEFLGTLIEGESLVNDGSAFVLWEAFIRNTTVPEGERYSIGEIIGQIFKLSLGGAAMGVAFGVAALIILGLIYDEFEVETSLTLIVAFLGFWTAQAPSGLSGVICNVASGLTISAFGGHLITPTVRGPLKEFWELLSWSANTVVFVHAGVLLTAFIWSCAGTPNTWVDYVLVLGYYLFLQIIRMGLILLFRPLMSIGNSWYRWKEATVVGFSGLRGSVSLVLALEVAARDEIGTEVRSRVILWTTGIVALSLIVNGFFIKHLITALRLDKAKKSREEFLHRARAVMVQRSLAILDLLCIETSFKSARWSYVVENILPKGWLEEQEHEAGYRDALAQIMDNNVAFNRKSLEIVKNEERRKMIHTEFNRRLSTDVQSIAPMSPEPAKFNAPGFTPSVEGSPPKHSANNTPATMQGASPLQKVADVNQQIAPLSLGAAAVGGGAYTAEGPKRRSIDADVARYGPNTAIATGRPSTSQIHRDVAELHRKARAGQVIHYTEQDREVQRRFLTAILSHVRAVSNAGFVEFSVLHSLEQDVQFALDANDEGEEYDLFGFLCKFGKKKGVFTKLYRDVVEGKRLKGQTAITSAFVVFGVLTEILKEEILHSSPIVLLQAEQLYEGAAALLNRLEALNPFAFEWVESQFAIYMTSRKQDEILEDMLRSGIVDEQEHDVIHHELVEVRRRHVRSRQSLFQRSTSHLAPRPKPRNLIREHPLFSELTLQQLSEVVDRYGELVHLKSGQSLQAEKGSLVLVLEGAIRPVDDSVLPKVFASQIKKSNTEVDTAVASVGSPGKNTTSPGADVDPPTMPARVKETTSNPADLLDDDDEKEDDEDTNIHGPRSLGSGATMHWCFPAHSGFCGPSITLEAHHGNACGPIAIAHERTIDTQFCCCEIAGTATVFSLPVAHVQKLAAESETFRTEITKSLAREIVLESVGDQRPYSLSHFVDSISDGVDVNTVVGRAFRVLERLPYMTVIGLEAGENTGVHVQGPGVLLNGTVRVSIVDTSGLIGAINLLHEELTGPALLPAGGLIIEDVQKGENTSEPFAECKEADNSESFHAGFAMGAAETAVEILQCAETEDENQQCTGGQPHTLAHLLIEEIAEDDKTAVRRLQRWTGKETQVDMNGRFGMYRHVDLTSLTATKVE